MKLSEITKELYDHIVKFRKQVSNSTVPNIATVFNEFETVFANMETKAQKNSQLHSEYQQVKFPLVALADEVVLNSNWSEAKEWEQYLLERKFFSTNIAGNQFFKLLEKADQMPPDVLREFFFCLAFGFKGGFVANDPSLKRLRGRLLDKSMPSSEVTKERILPGAYCVDLGETTKLKRLWKWWHVGVAMVIFFTLLVIIESAIIWPIILGNVQDNVETAKAVTEGKNVEGEAGDVPAKKAKAKASGYTILLKTVSDEKDAHDFVSELKDKKVKSKIYLVNDAGEKKYQIISGEYYSIESAAKKLAELKELIITTSNFDILELSNIKGKCVSGC